MKFRNLALAALTVAAVGTAHAAVSFTEPLLGDAGSTFGSTDTFGVGGGGLLSGTGLSLNGTSNSVAMEALDPGLVWGLITLRVNDFSPVQHPSGLSATFGGLSGTLLAPINSFSPVGWSYDFSFSGYLDPGSAPTLTLGGFTTTTNIPFVGTVNIPDVGSVTLTATAIPEPETYAMMLAGLGALGFMGRRRKVK